MPSPTPELVAGLQLLNPAQREQVEREVRLAEEALHGRSMYRDDPEMAGQDLRTWRGANFTPPDPQILREQIRRDRETLDRGTAPEFNGFQKNRIYQMVQEAEQHIREGMLSHEEMGKATHANVEHFMRHEEYTKRWQAIYLNGLRILDPHLESVSIEHLRGHAGGPRSRKPWEVGYVKITWTPEEELADALASLDDSTYLQFLQLRLQGVLTPKLIQEKLGVSRATYEACLRRLEQAAPAPVEPAPPATPRPVEADAKKLRSYYQRYGMDRSERQIALHLKMSMARVQAAQAFLASADEPADSAA